MRMVWIIITIVMFTTPPLAGAAIDIIKSADVSMESEDNIAPASGLRSPSVYLLPAIYDHIYLQPTIRIVWWGTDDPIDGGVDHFDVQYRYYRTDTYSCLLPYFGDWIDLLPNTKKTWTHFPVEGDHVYSFRVRAIDASGNVEDWPREDDSMTFVFRVPTDIYGRLDGIVDDVKGGVEDLRDTDTSPKSKVMPLPPIFIPNCYYDHGDGSTILYPDKDVSDIIPPVYHMIQVSWIGWDPLTNGGLFYDIQYMKGYMDRICYIPEDTLLCDQRPTHTEWTDWITGTNLTTGTFAPSGGGLYIFRSRAFDDDGNVERYPLMGDARTYVLPIY